MQGYLYQGRFVFRYLHIIILSFFFSIVFLLLSITTNHSFLILFIVFAIVTYAFLYASLPGDIIISDKGFFLKKKFFSRRKIFDIDNITEVSELEYNYKPSLFGMLISFFSTFDFLAIHQDQESYVLEITDSNLLTYRIYSYQTIHYTEVHTRLQEIVLANSKYTSFV